MMVTYLEIRRHVRSTLINAFIPRVSFCADPLYFVFMWRWRYFLDPLPLEIIVIVAPISETILHCFISVQIICVPVR